jgi:hypothetical protein
MRECIETPKGYSWRLSRQPLLFKNRLSPLESRMIGMIGILPSVKIPVELFTQTKLDADKGETGRAAP